MKKLFSFVCALVCALAINAETYIVTGSSSSLFGGGSWDLGKAPVLTKQADNSYAYTVEGVGLTAGDIEYKMVTKEGGWNGWKLPVDGNNKFNIAKAGTYNVTFTLSADLKSQNAVATLVSEGEVLPTIKLHGQFKDLTWSTLDEFTYNEAKTEATFVVTKLEPQKTYEFGLYFDGSWKANGATITASANSTNLEEGSGNMKLTTTIAGDYTFTYVLATHMLTVTYPAEEKKYTLTYGVIGENGTLTAMSGETAIESGAQVASATLTATPAEGYKVEGWYSNQEGTTALEGASGNTHTVVLSADMSVYVKFTIDNTPKDTVFFVNADKWTTVYCYAWTDGIGKNANYPGVKLTEKCNYQLQGVDVYFYAVEQGKYAKCLFNCGGDQCKSGDLTWDAGKYFYKGEWKTRAELESDEPIEDVITYGIGSNKNGYNSSNDKMTVSDDKATATCTIQLTKDEEFQFSVVETTNGTSDKWLKNTTTTITRENNSAVLAANGDNNNTHMTVDVTGTYTFVFTIENSTITVTYPSSTPTALTNTEAEKATVKVIRNGQVLIVREGVTYNMMGQVIQ